MAVVRCDKGHYYDDEKFTQCPHCGVLPVMQPEKPVKPKRFNFFHKDKDGAGRQAGAAVPPVQQPVPPQAPPAYDDRTVGISSPVMGMDDNRTIAFSQNSGASYPDDDNRTIAFSHTPTPSMPDDDNRTIAFSHTPTPSYPDDDNRTIAFTAPRRQNEDVDLEDTVPVEQPAAPPELKVPEPTAQEAAVQETAAQERNVPEPEAPEPAVEQPAAAKEKPQASVSRSLQMPEGRFAAGWLVCVKGAERGLDFRLYKGFNRIGTSDQADILLTEGDADEILCAVVYDDRSNRFYVVQQSETPAYRNGEMIQGAMELHAEDVLRVGTSEFEFIPFCRDGRTWNMDEA
ncbi:MAG: hypothetical protein Q4F76_05505 [Lachnospiraceae bacterium]|nr:hypothetical protein [Lachnospiraceae bacterium]